MSRPFVSALLIVGTCACAAQSTAAPIQLGSWAISAKAVGGGDYRNVTIAFFGLTLPVPGFVGSNFPLDSLSDGTSVDFDASNTPTFAEFTQRLTDGTYDLLQAQSAVVGPNAGEAESLNRINDLELFPTAQTWTVAFVRLIVRDWSLGPLDSCAVPGECSQPGITFRSDTEWQFWGEGVAPEPATVGLVVAALSLVAITRQRGQTQH